MADTYEIRDPVHGFVVLTDWERQIVDHPVVQRLRRVKQLGWTDMVYPGATHTRFEHSLGVMHVADRMFREISTRRKDFLKNVLSYDSEGVGIEIDRTIVRLAALMHDLGHGPFSHAAEELLPFRPDGEGRYSHEDYSAQLIRLLMKESIEGHPQRDNFPISAADVADFIAGMPGLGRRVLWREIISSQLDADRADYLLRDSHHIGVQYGKYDLDRLLVTMTVGLDKETGTHRLGVESGGMHAAEGLILARYMMFTQVYFQHARRAFDNHLERALRVLLAKEYGPEKATFPPPTSEQNLREYLLWDDWRVVEGLRAGDGGEHGQALLDRNHWKEVFRTKEVPDVGDLELFEQVERELSDLTHFTDSAENSWYKFGDSDVRILFDDTNDQFELLSSHSSVVAGLKAIKQLRAYCSKSDRDNAERIVERLRMDDLGEVSQ